MLEPVGQQRAFKPRADVGDVDLARRFERRDVVCLLGDQHRRARVPLAALDQLRQRVLLD